jgi:hypothetical protein
MYAYVSNFTLYNSSLFIAIHHDVKKFARPHGIILHSTKIHPNKSYTPFEDLTPFAISVPPVKYRSSRDPSQSICRQYAKRFDLLHCCFDKKQVKIFFSVRGGGS